MNILDKRYLLPFVPLVLTCILLVYSFVYLDSFFIKMDENVYFKIESIIALLVITSYVFVITNTIYYGFDIFRKNEIVVKAKNSRPISRTLIRIAYWSTWGSILLSLGYSLFIFLYASKGFQDQTSFSEIITYNNLISLIVFIFFLIIDICVYYALKSISSNNPESHLSSTLEYLKNSLMMIDAPAILGIIIVFMISSMIEDYHNNGVTTLGSGHFGEIFSFNKDILPEIKHLTLMTFSAGAIAMQVIFSQVIFTVLGVKNAKSF